jgi:hypothetical protein
MWGTGILKLKIEHLVTGSKLSPGGPFVSNQQLETQGLVFKTYIFNFIKKICTPTYNTHGYSR